MANGAHIMLCPGEHCYLDYPMARGDMPEVNWGMPTTSLKQTYSLEPSWGREKKFEESHLYGVAGTLWSECITTPERLFYQAYPRAIALAEVGWSQPSKRSWASFCKRLQPLLADMMHRGLPFSMEYEGGEKGRKH
jgi:hexosaminidase